MLLDITQEDRQLWVSYFNLDGKTRFKTYDLKPEDMFNWEVCDEGDTKADSKMKNWATSTNYYIYHSILSSVS
jgi:hypothetical protein